MNRLAAPTLALVMALGVVSIPRIVRADDPPPPEPEKHAVVQPVSLHHPAPQAPAAD